MIVLARIKANGNFIDASLKRLLAVSGLGINGVMSPSDAFDLESSLVVSEMNVPEHCFFAFMNNLSRH